MVVVYCDMISINIGVKLSKPKTTDKHSHSMFAYLDSTGVRVLEANATGLFCWMSAAPGPYSLASV